MAWKKKAAGAKPMTWDWFEDYATEGSIAKMLTGLAKKKHRIVSVLPWSDGRVLVVSCKGSWPKKAAPDATESES